MSTVPVTGSVKPFVPGQRVEVSFYLNGDRVEARKVRVKGGSFRTRIRIEEAGKYAASARLPATRGLRGDSTVRKSWRVSFPSLHRGQCGDVVIGFKKAMRKMGYIANSGRCFGGKTARGVLAYRKVNGLARSFRAGKGLVKRAFAGKGEYRGAPSGGGQPRRGAALQAGPRLRQGRQAVCGLPDLLGQVLDPDRHRPLHLHQDRTRL